MILFVKSYVNVNVSKDEVTSHLSKSKITTVFCLQSRVQSDNRSKYRDYHGPLDTIHGRECWLDTRSHTQPRLAIIGEFH